MENRQKNHQKTDDGFQKGRGIGQDPRICRRDRRGNSRGRLPGERFKARNGGVKAADGRDRLHNPPYVQQKGKRTLPARRNRGDLRRNPGKRFRGTVFGQFRDRLQPGAPRDARYIVHPRENGRHRL